MEELNNSLDIVVELIKNSDEYKKCISLREKMRKNSEIVELVEEIKKLQKEYIKSNYDSLIKEKLDYTEERLYRIPIYIIYNQELNKVNDKINYVRDRLNDYFYKLLNSKES